jgi:hypothetical protein
MRIYLNFPDAITEPCISREFLQGMLDRMAVSYFKYGPVTTESLSNRDLQECIRTRLDAYGFDGNTEWLMDAANFAMMEYMVPKHPDAHFRATEGDESPGVQLLDGTSTHKHYREL